MARNMPAVYRGGSVHRVMLELATGPKTRAELIAAGIPASSLSHAVKVIKAKGWGAAALQLSADGLATIQQMSGWQYDARTERRRCTKARSAVRAVELVPLDHLVEQVRQYRGVRWG